jgi:hypothetical protein
VVNDTSATSPPSGDGIPNSQQWSVQTNFRAGVAAFGDRTVTINSTGNGSLGGKTWIRTARRLEELHRKPARHLHAHRQLPVPAGRRPAQRRRRQASVAGRQLHRHGLQRRHRRGATLRPYSVWRKSVTSGGTVSLPRIASAIAPCYLVVVE